MMRITHISQIPQQQFFGLVQMYLSLRGQAFRQKVRLALLQKTFQSPLFYTLILSEIALALPSSHLQALLLSTARIMLLMTTQKVELMPLPFWPTSENNTLFKQSGSRRNMQLFVGNILSAPAITAAYTLVQVVIAQSLQNSSPYCITEKPYPLFPQVLFIWSEMQSRRAFVSSWKQLLAELMKLMKEEN